MVHMNFGLLTQNQKIINKKLYLNAFEQKADRMILRK